LETKTKEAINRPQHGLIRGRQGKRGASEIEWGGLSNGERKGGRDREQKKEQRAAWTQGKKNRDTGPNTLDEGGKHKLGPGQQTKVIAGKGEEWGVVFDLKKKKKPTEKKWARSVLTGGRVATRTAIEVGSAKRGAQSGASRCKKRKKNPKPFGGGGGARESARGH